MIEHIALTYSRFLHESPLCFLIFHSPPHLFFSFPEKDAWGTVLLQSSLRIATDNAPAGPLGHHFFKHI